MKKLDLNQWFTHPEIRNHPQNSMLTFTAKLKEDVENTPENGGNNENGEIRLNENSRIGGKLQNVRMRTYRAYTQERENSKNDGDDSGNRSFLREKSV